MANLKWYGSREVRWFGFIGIRYRLFHYSGKPRIWKSLNTVHIREEVRRIYRGIPKSSFKDLWSGPQVYQDFLVAVICRV